MVPIRTLIIILVAVAFVVVGILLLQGGGGKGGSNEYRKVGDQFMAAITGSNPEAAYNLMTDDLQGEKSKDGWTAALNETFQDYTEKAEFIEDSSDEDREAAYKKSGVYPLKYRLSSGDKTYVVYIGIGKELNSWKVSEFLNNTQFIDSL